MITKEYIIKRFEYISQKEFTLEEKNKIISQVKSSLLFAGILFLEVDLKIEEFKYTKLYKAIPIIL